MAEINEIKNTKTNNFLPQSSPYPAEPLDYVKQYSGINFGDIVWKLNFVLKTQFSLPLGVRQALLELDSCMSGIIASTSNSLQLEINRDTGLLDVEKYERLIENYIQEADKRLENASEEQIIQYKYLLGTYENALSSAKLSASRQVLENSVKEKTSPAFAFLVKYTYFKLFLDCSQNYASNIDSITVERNWEDFYIATCHNNQLMKKDNPTLPANVPISQYFDYVDSYTEAYLTYFYPKLIEKFKDCQTLSAFYESLGEKLTVDNLENCVRKFASTNFTEVVLGLEKLPIIKTNKNLITAYQNAIANGERFIYELENNPDVKISESDKLEHIGKVQEEIKINKERLATLEAVSMPETNHSFDAEINSNSTIINVTK